ncbi:membrane protein [Nonlabens marinus]|uniref:Putative outer membrane protein n=1 Tax=Nonlabens marinus S1-08 TaxID=1454201 RepID=W8VR50_9FLAO|nr:membrane protein [Nonlabens marinus]BAO55450.1 putative outer membrane protein [Nonlabens marinus S1-08]
MIRSILTVLFLFTIMGSWAQSRTSSPYSFFGLGQQTFRGTIENRSMAGIRTYSDSIHLNLQNPASYSKLRLTTYAIGMNHTETFASTEDSNDTYDATSIQYVSIGVPVSPKTAFGFGLIPFQSVGYTIGSVSPERYSRFTGEGSLNRAYFSLGHQLTKNISIGGEFRYNFGEETNSSSIAFNEVQFGTREENETDLSGISFNLAINYDKILDNGNSFNASFIYQPEADITARNVRRLSTITVGADLTENIFVTRESPETKQELKLREEYTIGIGYGKPLNWNLAAEYSLRGSSSSAARSFAPDNSEFTDAASYRVGGFYIPNFNSISSYWDRVVYRGGMRYEESGLRLNGEDVNEFGISFGLGLPIGRGASFSNANIGFEYGQRGTQNAGLIKEDFFSISIGLSLNDRWFQKRRYN